jgi:hypothetical protein
LTLLYYYASIIASESVKERNPVAERPALLTALIILPVKYNPNVQGIQKPIEDEKFIKTAEEIAKTFGGGTIHRYPPRKR